MCRPRRDAAVQAHFVLLLLAGLAARAQAAEPREDHHPSRVIVQFKEAPFAIAGAGAVTTLSSHLNIYSVEAPQGAAGGPAALAARLQQQPGVLFAEADFKATAASTPKPKPAAAPPKKKAPPARHPAPTAKKPSPPRPRPPPRRPPPPPRPPLRPGPNDYFWGQQTQLMRVNAPMAWSFAPNGNPNITVCLVDSGIYYDHEDLKGSIYPLPAGELAKQADDYGLGTQLAGIIGAQKNNRLGVAGIASGVRLLPCRAIDADGNGFASQIVACVDFCRIHKARVINIALQLTNPSQALLSSLKAASAAGAFIAVAAGNYAASYKQQPVWPALYAPQVPGMLAIAATRFDDMILDAGSFGLGVTRLAAPGDSLFSTSFERVSDLPKGPAAFYDYGTGTSRSAAMVSGTAALMLSAARRQLNNTRLVELLLETAEQLPYLGGLVDNPPNLPVGAGGAFLHMGRAVAAAAARA